MIEIVEEISRYDLYRDIGENRLADTPAPDFTLLNADARPWKLSDQRMKL